MRKDNSEFTLKELFSIFLPKIWIIVLCGVIFAGAIGSYSLFLKDDEFTASATIYVYKERPTDTAANTYYDSITSEKMVKTYSVVLKSRKFLSQVIASVDPDGQYGLTTKGLISAIEIKQVDETEVFDVYFTSEDKELTHKVLSEIALLARTELKDIVSSTASDVKIIDEPEMPSSPDSKHTVRNAAIGFIAGVLLSMAVIFIINQFDVVIHDKQKIEENFDLPVLGVIPRQNVTAKRNGGDGKNAEQYGQHGGRTLFVAAPNQRHNGKGE